MRRRATAVAVSGGLMWTLAVAAVSLSGCGGLSRGGVPEDGGPNPGVYPPSATPFGETYGEWGARWWQWVFSVPDLPDAPNPLYDMTGERAAVGQSGPVWFLAGTMGPTVERTCTVPAGKAILFPLLNAFWVATIPEETEPVMRANCRDGMDHVTELWATVDGVSLRGLFAYRFEAPRVFFATFPEVGGLWGVPGGAYPAFQEGFWIMLEPPAPGEHALTWGGRAVNPATPPNVDVFEQNITYHLTVE